jgi:hypothetical protein
MDGAFGYLGARLALRDLTRDVVLGLAGGRVLDGAAPAVARLIAEIAARLGLALSERAAAAALPILGVLGSVTLNVVFMDHFARVAEGHFTVRRLERRHGEAAIRAHYRAAAA